MGKKQHSKDLLHQRPSEWAQDGRGFKDRKRNPFQTLPLHCCALSQQPFENPVGTVNGSVFEGKNAIRYIKRFGKHPITGARLEISELFPVHFHKNTDGEMHCPVTFKVFTNHSHVVMSTASGQIYSFDAVDQLNRKTKHWKDLITSEPFKWSDIVTIQDPDNIEARDVAKFYYMTAGQQEEVIAEVTHRESKITPEQKADTIRKNPAMDRIWDEKQKLADEKAKEEAEKTAVENANDDVEADKRQKTMELSLQPIKKTNERYTSGAVAESFTSTTRTLQTSNDLRLQTEEEALQDLYDTVRKNKSKAYVRLNTTVGMLNMELHADICPRTTDNFLRLCEKEYYDNTIFHRLIHNFMLQGGDPTGTGRGGKSAFEGGRPFRDEIDTRLSHSGPGIVSMANNGKTTNKSQFFITIKSCQHLDGKHSVFGRIVGGLNLLEELNKWETDEKDRPVKPIKMVKVEVFKNPFKEAIEEAAKPKVEKAVDPVATWFSNRTDPMQEHKNRESTAVGKYMEYGIPGSGVKPVPSLLMKGSSKPAFQPSKELPVEEMEYVNVAQKKKKLRTSFDFSTW